MKALEAFTSDPRRTVVPRPGPAPRPAPQPAPRPRPPRKPPPSAEVRARWDADLEIVRETLRRFPIFAEPQPMKIGIGVELIQYCRAVLHGELGRERIERALRRFLRDWTRRPDYLKSLATGGPRFDVWLKPVGEVTNREREAARRALRPKKPRPKPGRR